MTCRSSSPKHFSLLHHPDDDRQDAADSSGLAAYRYMLERSQGRTMLEFKELMTVFQVVIVILSYGIEQGNIVSVFHQRGWIFHSIIIYREGLYLTQSILPFLELLWVPKSSQSGPCRCILPLLKVLGSNGAFQCFSLIGRFTISSSHFISQ